MFFRGNFGWLSNSYTCPVTVAIGGRVRHFSCAEAAYQAYKCPERAEEFESLSGYAARDLGRSVKLRPDWNKVKIVVMKRVLQNKFAQNEELADRLVKLDTPIINDNRHGDKFWGQVNGEGHNYLGRLIQDVRAETIARRYVIAQNQTNMPSGNNMPEQYPIDF